MSDFFKIVLLTSACIIHLTEVSHTVKGKSYKKSVSELPFDAVRRFRMSGLEDDYLFLNLMVKLTISTSCYVTYHQEDDPKSSSQSQKNN